MGLRNILLLVFCLSVNLLVGNIVLSALFSQLQVGYHIAISLVVMGMYSFLFYEFSQGQKRKIWKSAMVSVLLSLGAMLVACVFLSISTKFPHDSVLVAALKGVIPVFVFAIPVTFPFWISLAIVNFVCLVFVKPQSGSKNLCV